MFELIIWSGRLTLLNIFRGGKKKTAWHDSGLENLDPIQRGKKRGRSQAHGVKSKVL